MMRILAIGGVVLIHTSTRILEAVNFDLVHAQFTLFTNQAARFAVPMFFMISGFVLELNYDSETGYVSYVKKRASRIVIPYIFWSAIYYWLVYTQHTIGFGQSLLTGNSSYQLYFIPTLLIFYLIFPLLHKLGNIWNNWWVMLGLGAVQVMVLYYCYFISPLPVIYPVAMVLVNFYVFMMGMVVANSQARIINIIKKIRLLLPILILSTIGIIYWEGYHGYLTSHDYLKFYSQWRPSVLIYTLCLGGLSFYIFNKLKCWTNIIKKISGLTFFVFFVHVIVLENVWKWWGKGISGGIFFGLVTGMSLLAAYLVHKVPGLAKITG